MERRKKAGKRFTFSGANDMIKRNILVALVFGIICTYLVASHVTSEVDELYDVVKNLISRQEQFMQAAMPDKEVPPKVQNYLEKISSSSDYLLSLINDILDMSKIESGKMKLEMLDFDLEQWVRNIDDLIGPQAAQKGILYTTKPHLIQKWVP